MATTAAHRRLTREYQNIQKNPPPYIIAHPSETNILEWHYILTGPPSTPYSGGQYWGTLLFPPTYPFSPPAILMHTPSGRFTPSTRLCLSISDFHPKSFNPAWTVSTILLGLLSFMTSDEMTTGSIRAGEGERRVFAARSRWWNSTGGGGARGKPGVVVVQAENKARAGAAGKGMSLASVKAGDGGANFRSEWREVDEQNWTWMREMRIDPATGKVQEWEAEQGECSAEVAALRRRLGGSGGVGAVVQEGRNASEIGRGWLRDHLWWVLGGMVFAWGVASRVAEVWSG